MMFRVCVDFARVGQATRTEPWQGSSPTRTCRRSRPGRRLVRVGVPATDVRLTPRRKRVRIRPAEFATGMESRHPKAPQKAEGTTSNYSQLVEMGEVRLACRQP